MEENQQDNPLRPELQGAIPVSSGEVPLPLLPSVPQLPTGGYNPTTSARFTTITGEDWKRALRIARPRRSARRQAISNYINQGLASLL